MAPSAPHSADDPSSGDTENPDVRCVLEALYDDDCRDIIRTVCDAPKTATELSEGCDIPLSTVYRKLDILTRSRLLQEGTRVQTGGKHAMQYELHVADIHVHISDDGRIDVAVPPDCEMGERS